MKKIMLLAAALIMAVSGVVYGGEDTLKDVFPDPVFCRAVCEAAGKNEDDIFSSCRDDISLITEIHSADSGITSLEGIEYLSCLEILDVSGNLIEKADLSLLKKLKVLIASQNPMSEIILPEGGVLESVYLQDCALKEADIPAGVVKLYIQRNHISSLDTGSLLSLRELNISCNRLTAIDLSGNEDLQYLWLSDNHLYDITLPVNPRFVYADPGSQYYTVGIISGCRYVVGEKIISSSHDHENGVMTFDMDSLPQYVECVLNIGGYEVCSEFSVVDFRGDINGDMQINNVDLSYLLGNYLSDDETSDIDGDGSVKSADLSVLLSSYSKKADVVIK